MMDESKAESVPHYGGRIQLRRSSRSGIPTTKEDRSGALPESTAPSTSSSSAATESNSNEESPNISTTTVNGKRRRNRNSTRNSNKKKSGGSTAVTPTSPSSSTSTSMSPSSTTTTSSKNLSRGTGDETRNATLRLSKEAKDARKVERDISIQRKLDELDTLEQNVKDQSHEEYQKVLQEMQSKRAKKLNATQGRLALMETNFKNGFFAQKKLANDKFYLEKSALRQKMMKHVQQQINTIEQEYYLSQQGAKDSLDYQHLTEWAPPDRSSMISSLTLGLDKQEVTQDIAELQDLVRSEQFTQDKHPSPLPPKDPLPSLSPT